MTSCEKFIEQFRKLYQNVTIDDLNNEWEYFQENNQNSSLAHIPEFKRGQLYQYSISLFKELDQLLSSKKITYKELSSLFKQHILLVFEDPPDFAEGQYIELYQSCLTKIQSFYTLSLMPSSKQNDLDKLYSDSKELVCYYSQIFDENEAEIKEIQKSQKESEQPKKEGIKHSQFETETKSITPSKTNHPIQYGTNTQSSVVKSPSNNQTSSTKSNHATPTTAAKSSSTATTTTGTKSSTTTPKALNTKSTSHKTPSQAKSSTPASSNSSSKRTNSAKSTKPSTTYTKTTVSKHLYESARPLHKNP